MWNKAFLLGIDDDYCGSFGQPILNFGLLNEEEIAEEIAKIRNIDVSEIIDITTKNAERFFRI